MGDDAPELQGCPYLLARLRQLHMNNVSGSSPSNIAAVSVVRYRSQWKQTRVEFQPTVLSIPQNQHMNQS